MFEIGGTLNQELQRTAEMMVSLSTEQGVYFAIAMLVDSGYDPARMRKLLEPLKYTRGAIVQPERFELAQLS